MDGMDGVCHRLAVSHAHLQSHHDSKKLEHGPRYFQSSDTNIHMESLSVEWVGRPTVSSHDRYVQHLGDIVL